MISMNNQLMPIEISELGKSILAKEPLQRKEEDINQLIEDDSLTQLTFIKDLLKTKMNNLKALLECLKIFYLNPNEEAYKIGDKPKDCFFLLEGSLDIFSPEIKRISNTTQFVIEQRRNIHQGEMFGEKELITSSLSRESTVSSTTHSLIGKITKRDYLKIYDIAIRRFQHDYLTLFKSIKLFRSKGKVFIEKFVREMIVKDYQAGEQILSRDKPCDMIYIIRSGSVTVVNEVESSEFNYSFDYNAGEMFGDIEIFLNKKLSQFSIYSRDSSCQLFCCQRNMFVKLLGAFVSEFNSLTRTKITRIKTGMGEMNKSKLFRSKSDYQFIDVRSNLECKAKKEDEGNNHQLYFNYSHFNFKKEESNKYECQNKLRQTSSILYKQQHFFRRPMKSITAISCKIDECQRLRARETIINMVPVPKISNRSKLKLMHRPNPNELHQDAALNNQIAFIPDQNQSSHLMRSSTLSSFPIQRNTKKKTTYELNNQEKYQLVNTQVKLAPSPFYSQMLRRTSFTQKMILNRERILSLFNSNLDVLRSHL